METIEYTIAPAEAEDLAQVVDLVNSAYRGRSSREGWTTEADYIDGTRTTLAALAKELEFPRAKILVLRADDNCEILGCVYIRYENQGAPKGYLGMLTVNPRLQSTGLGHRLLKFAEAYMQENWRIEIVRLTVIHLRGPLIAWYERRGYKKTGQTEPFPYGEDRFGIPRREDLAFMVFEKKLDASV